MEHKLIRSSNDQLLSGVCGGIADFFGISSFVVRLIFIFTNPVSIWIYLILTFALDERPTFKK